MLLGGSEVGGSQVATDLCGSQKDGSTEAKMRAVRVG